jgi:hypothetical protein
MHLIHTLLGRKHFIECLLNEVYDEIQRKVWDITEEALIYLME